MLRSSCARSGLRDSDGSAFARAAAGFGFAALEDELAGFAGDAVFLEGSDFCKTGGFSTAAGFGEAAAFSCAGGVVVAAAAGVVAAGSAPVSTLRPG